MQFLAYITWFGLATSYIWRVLFSYRLLPGRLTENSIKHGTQSHCSCAVVWMQTDWQKIIDGVVLYKDPGSIIDGAGVEFQPSVWLAAVFIHVMFHHY